jgi:hypothetical protein
MSGLLSSELEMRFVGLFKSYNVRVNNLLYTNKAVFFNCAMQYLHCLENVTDSTVLCCSTSFLKAF